MDKLKLTLVMLIWGSIGIFTRYIDLNPMVLAFFRAACAIPVLGVYIVIKKISLRIPIARIWPYVASGVLLGFGWAGLLFGYKNTDTSSAVIVYNMCPIYVMAAAPFILKERLTATRAAIILICFVGLYLVVGARPLEGHELWGMLLAGGSGILYAAIVIINRKITHKLDGTVSAMIQITVAAIILLPFALSGRGLAQVANLDARGLTMAVILGTVHTGVAYSLYFSVYMRLKSIDIVSYSYLEPVFCIILGIAFLGERLTPAQWAGGALILGATYIGEYINYKRGRVNDKSEVLAEETAE